MKKWAFDPKTLIYCGLGGQMPFFFTYNIHSFFQSKKVKTHAATTANGEEKKVE